MVNPGGTGSPSLVISARLAPLPPSRSAIVRSPSWKSYTYLAIANPPSLRRCHLTLQCDGWVPRQGRTRPHPRDLRLGSSDARRRGGSGGPAFGLEVWAYVVSAGVTVGFVV